MCFLLFKEVSTFRCNRLSPHRSIPSDARRFGPTQLEGRTIVTLFALFSFCSTLLFLTSIIHSLYLTFRSCHLLIRVEAQALPTLRQPPPCLAILSLSLTLS